MKKFTLLALALPLAMTLGVNNANAEGFGVHGSFALPMGDFADFAGLGFGGGVQYEKSLNENMNYGIDASYLMFGEESGVTFSVIPILAKAKYFFGGNENMNFYGSLGTGYYLFLSSFDSDLIDDETEGKFGFVPGIGMTMNQFDFSAQYHFADGSKGNFLGINVGYNF